MNAASRGLAPPDHHSARNDHRRTAPRLRDVRWLAGLLGIPVKTVYDEVTKGRVPGVFRLGTRIRFVEAEVLAWIHSGGSSN